MRLIAIGPALLLTWAIHAGAQHKVFIQPMDFQDDAEPRSFTSEIMQIEARGERLLIRSLSGRLIEIDRHGRYTSTIGPAEVGDEGYQQLSGFAVWGDRIAALNTDKSVFLFDKDEFHSQFNAKRFAAYYAFPMLNANRFGFDGARVILPAPRQTGWAAQVYDGDGRLLEGFGEPPSFEDALIRANPAVGASFWTWDGALWHCLFKFKPILRQYDADLNLVAELELASDEIAECEAGLSRLTPQQRARKHAIPPHFTDFKIFRGRLYAMCRGALLQIDADTGKTLQSWRFFGNGPDFEHMPPGQRLTLPLFAFLPDGKLILAHPALMWNHDLWRADIFSPAEPGGTRAAADRE